jgi:hypothetical protein
VRSSSSPFVGPKPFAVEDGKRFFGRDDESAELLSLVMANPVTLLYSESGAGKTSLINAKTITGLLLQECDVIGPVRVSGEFSSELIECAGKNAYVASALLLMKRSDEDISETELTRMSMADYLSRRPRPVLHSATAHAITPPIRPPRVIIFDQFEELFTTRHDRWQDRQGFFQQLGSALEADPRLRILIAMREEFVAGIDSYALELPDPLRSRFRLERLRRETALQAMREPLRGTGVHFAAGVDELLVDKLLLMTTNEGNVATGEFVEPLHLQIVLDRIWRALPEDVSTISSDFIEAHADIDAALAAYYDECVADVAAEMHQSEGELRTRIQKSFITSDGYRGLVYGTRDNAAGDWHREVLEALQRRYLIRAEVRGMSCWYELTHDRLIPAVLSSNMKWRESSHVGHFTVASLERMANEWSVSRSKALLLRGDDFAKVTTVLKERGDTVDVSESLRQFVDASEIARERRRATRFGLQLVAGILAAVVFAMVAWRQHELIQQRDHATSSERALVARTLKEKNSLATEVLAWAIRAHAVPKFGRTNTELLRDALRGVGATRWLSIPGAEIQNALFSPKGNELISVSDKILEVWDRRGGTSRRQIVAPVHRVWVDAFFTRSGRLIIAKSTPDPAERRKDFLGGSDTDQLRCDVIDWRRVDPTKQPNGSVVPALWKIPRHVDVSVSPDDKRVALIYAPTLDAASRANWIRVFDVGTSKPPILIKATNTTKYISLSMTGRRLLTYDDQTVSVWDVGRRAIIGRIPQVVNRDANPVIKWFGDDKLVFGFKNAPTFRPTLVYFSKGRMETRPLDVPPMIREAQFSPDGHRLIVKTDNGNRQKPVVQAFEIDDGGHVIKQLEVESAYEYYHYRNYFADNGKEGLTTFIRCNDEGKGCYLSTLQSAKRELVRLEGLQFLELTSISYDARQLLSVSGGVARLWTMDRHTRSVETLNEQELVAESCERLENQRQLVEITQIDGGCRTSTLQIAGTGGVARVGLTFWTR